MINQNQKISYLSEVLTPLNRTFFSVQSLFLSVGQAFLKIVIRCYKRLPRPKTAR